MKLTTLLSALGLAAIAAALTALTAPALHSGTIPLYGRLITLQATYEAESDELPGQPYLIGEAAAWTNAYVYLDGVTADFTSDTSLSTALYPIEQDQWDNEALSGDFPAGSEWRGFYDGNVAEYGYILSAITFDLDCAPLPTVPPGLPVLHRTDVSDWGSTAILVTLGLVALTLYRTFDDDLGIGFWVVGGISVVITAIMIACAIAYDYLIPSPPRGRTTREIARGQWYEV